MTDRPDRQTPERYTQVAIILHWALAAALLGLTGFGLLMTRMADGPVKFAIYQSHKTMGVLVLLLVGARLAWRLMNPPPEPMTHWSAREKRLSHAVHIGFYALMLATPLLGWAYVSASTTNLPTLLFGLAPWPHLPILPELGTETRKGLEGGLKLLHRISALSILALLALHVAGALKHQFQDRDGTLGRMGVGPGRRSARASKGRRAVFASVIAVLVGGVAVGAAGQGGSAAAVLSDQRSAQAWSIDEANSTLRFSGAAAGTAFEGRFERWSADVVFDPNRPDATAITVEVDIGSAAFGNPFYANAATGSDWLAAAQFPTARFTAEGATALGEGRFQTEGVLSLRGVEQPVTLAFEFEPQPDGSAQVQGQAEILRRLFGIGVDVEGDDQTTPIIDVNFTILASRP
ncbi:MAG: cytochrome b/b6 domain-containing protein [Maricaulaceae bacterium]